MSLPTTLPAATPRESRSPRLSLTSRGKRILRSTSLPARRALWSARVSAYGQFGILASMRRRQRGGLRILTYHGICRDQEQGLPWIPSFFVTQTLFERHLRWLREAGEVVPLRTALDLCGPGCESRDLVYAITFDDGYFNNVSLALPILAAHGAMATFFLTTGPVDAGGIVPPWMRARMLQCLCDRGRISLDPHAAGIVADACNWGGRAAPADQARRLEPLWAEHARQIDPAHCEAVRSMSWDEARQLTAAGMELGAHTQTHPHLARMPDPGRRLEMAESVSRVRQFSGVEVSFAYPFGRPSDFSEFDVGVLRELGVPLAVSTDHGVNRPGTSLDPYRLKRLAVSRRRTREDFLAMVSGLYDHDRLWQPPD